ncbi:membrane protein [Mucilaginibacter yixingensis]|uniref:Membrane protein n=1 Tax=Mucilaginibacter yixingensis TaxID=1295612 RepID=A0A2T5JDE3_9SPHI|nr:YihY/virulence factor BrkB family protein [Mucilaginibacter yixingensis]PTQ99790.1 membrane protein [Mucilaginibacter yixingensis]
MKIFNRDFLRHWWKILGATFSGFIADNGLKLSASLAYYTIFSLAPLLILVLSVIGIFLKDPQTRIDFYHQIQHYMGRQATLQIQSVIKTQDIMGKSGMGLIIGVVTLMLGASSIFIEMQDSLNIIWRVKAKPRKGWLKLLKNRFLSFSLIVSLGFLLLASLLVNIIISALSDQIDKYLPRLLGPRLSHLIGETFLMIVNLGITLAVISVLFSIIFKVLPDVKIKWRDVRSGAIFTAVLFVIGQYLISLYIKYTAQGSAYGTAGSIIVILVWIYYTAAILYIGAEFTQVYAEARGSDIEPAEYAVHVEQKEVLETVRRLPPQNPELKGELNQD